MPTSTILSQVKGDFFAILIPGFYTLTTIISEFLAFTQTPQSFDVFKRLGAYFKILKDYWPLIFVIFIAAYLLGILLRSIRVNRSDRTTGKVFEKLPFRESWTKLGYRSEFPYPTMLDTVKKELEKSEQVSSFVIPPPECLHNTYNYWKLVICSESEAMFNYISNLEATVRLFVGMFWAGFIGVVGYVVILIGCLCNDVIKTEMWNYSIVMLITSIIIMLMFGMNIRRTRVQETMNVFMAFLVLKQKKEATEATAKKKAKPAPVGQSGVLQFLSGMFNKNQPH